MIYYKKNAVENQIYLKLIKNLYILKLFNIYIIEENKLNKFEKTYKIIYLFFFIFSFILLLLFCFLFLKFYENQV